MAKDAESIKELEKIICGKHKGEDLELIALQAYLCRNIEKIHKSKPA